MPACAMDPSPGKLGTPSIYPSAFCHLVASLHHHTSCTCHSQTRELWFAMNFSWNQKTKSAKTTTAEKLTKSKHKCVQIPGVHRSQSQKGRHNHKRSAHIPKVRSDRFGITRNNKCFQSSFKKKQHKHIGIFWCTSSPCVLPRCAPGTELASPLRSTAFKKANNTKQTLVEKTKFK